MNKQKILFLVGLPASGKSTFAINICNEDSSFIRINKDDIRELLGNQPFSRDFENLVLNIQRYIGNSLLDFGKSIIVDDTNFSPKHREYWEKNSTSRGIGFEVLTFNTKVEECIKRDSEREKSVGKKVILDMYEKYLKLQN